MTQALIWWWTWFGPHSPLGPVLAGAFVGAQLGWPPCAVAMLFARTVR